MSTTIEATLEEIAEITPEETVSSVVLEKKKRDRRPNPNKIKTEAAEKRGKGRPNIHPFAGRTYLLKDEITAALEDTAAFALKMEDVHALSDERKATLQAAGYLNNQDTIDFTLNGPIVETLDRAIALGKSLEDENYTVSYKISKERIVPANKPESIEAEVEMLESGKSRILKNEFSPNRIYVYLSASPVVAAVTA